MGEVKKRILVLGNGAAGSQFTAKMAKCKKYCITVITPFSYSEISVNMTKVIAVGPSEHMKSVYPLVREENVEYLIDQCTALNSNCAQLATGRSIKFDVCVVATGQHMPVFQPDINLSLFKDRKDFVSDLHSKLTTADSVVIGGGGAVGTELAADIKLRNKQKRVVLVSSSSTLLGGMSEPFRELAAQHLQKIGVELIMSQRVLLHEGGEVVLDSGLRLPCDLYLPAHPQGGNSSFLPTGCVDERGYVKVDDCFRVQLLNNVFAFGDCADMDSVKTYPKIYDQLGTLRHNIQAHLHNEPLRHHVRGKTMMGRFDGPLMVALGHGIDNGEELGLGPDCPGLLGTLCWLGCFFSWPCSYPHGTLVAKIKSDFNNTIQPRKGKGFSG